MRILGIDPGSLITGYGIIDQTKGKQTYITSGCIKVAGKPLMDRLLQIYKDLKSIIKEYLPKFAAIEQVFMHKNAASALKLGHARGVAALTIAEAGIEVIEYSPRQVKQGVVGYGGAEKKQIQHMVKVLLNLNTTPKPDAADALAVAICHGNFLTKAIK